MIRDVRAREGGDENASPRPLPVPSSDVPSVEEIRELSEARVRAQVQAAKQRAAQQRDNRQEFARRRRIGLRERHSLKIARQNLTADHNRQNGDQQP